MTAPGNSLIARQVRQAVEVRWWSVVENDMIGGRRRSQVQAGSPRFFATDKYDGYRRPLPEIDCAGAPAHLGVGASGSSLRP